MTTFTTEDKEQSYKKMLEEAPAHVGYEDAVEPIPFAGWVSDVDEKEQMLRDQIRMQQNEIGRLKAKLMENGIND